MKKRKKWVKETLWPGVITAFVMLGIGTVITLVLLFDVIKFLVISTIMLCVWIWFTIRKILSKKYLKVRSQRMLISSMNAFEKRLPLILTAFIVFMLWIVTTYLCVSYGIKFDSPVRTIFVGMAISFVVGIFLFELIKANSDKIVETMTRLIEKLLKMARKILIALGISLLVGLFLFELVKTKINKMVKAVKKLLTIKWCWFSFIDQHFFVWKKCNWKNWWLLYI